ncbi:hypothetical protein D6D22_10208 [Aureobasidium pullulans]|uniref:F-box domain-containing protein n=1 Tax=Aureobasidium pullulans TaxID=5580 RepID=A0A4V4IFK1_AURPU|nr:hypothetical protein D6D22_10208 [Aureobasidium pullulans]
MGNTPSMPTTAGASLSELPLELVVCIAEHLPPESIAAMALTTKSLYESLQFKQMWRPKIKCRPNKLISLLARDVQQSVLCTSCHRLHPHSTGTWLHLDPWNYHIQFEDVYEIMSRHRWGKLGEDLSSIATHTAWKVMTTADLEALDGRSHAKGDVRLDLGRCLAKFDAIPLIIDGNLVLQTTQSMWYHPEMWEEMQKYGIGRHPFRHCKHWNLPTSEDAPDFLTLESEMFCCHIRKCLNALDSLRRTEQPNISHHETTEDRICARCTTEYKTDVWDHGKGGVEVRLHTYTDLGPCIEPTEVHWFSAAHHQGDMHDADYCREANYHLLSEWGSYRRVGSVKRVAYSAIGCASFERALSKLDIQGDVSGDLELWKAVKRAYQSCSEQAARRHPRRLRTLWETLTRK